MKKTYFALLLTIGLCSGIFSQSEYCIDIKIRGNNKPGEYYIGKKSHFPGSPEPYVEFGVPDSSHVKFIVEDIYGMQIGNKVDCIIPGGDYKLAHEVFFRNIEYSSGVYFVKMYAELSVFKKSDQTDFIGSTKILVVK